MRHLFENSPIGIAVLDREGRITQWNRAAVRMLGWSEDEMRGKPISSFCTEPGCEAGKAFARPQAEICEVDGQCRLAASDGRLIDVELRLRPLRDESGETHRRHLSVR